MDIITASIIKKLYTPPVDSHKGDNGQVLIIGGSRQYHGAPILAAKIAGKIVDLVYFCSTVPNNEIINRLKGQLAEFIIIPRFKLETAVKASDAVLVGPGLENNDFNRQELNHLLRKFPNKKWILDATALHLVKPSTLNKNCVVTPHHGEFRTLFHLPPTAENVLASAKEYGCVIVLKGQEDYISDGKTLWKNRTGNAGMTKGGTGDVLAGLIAALAAKNDLLLSAQVGIYLNGRAGDDLKQSRSFYFNASDLIEQIPLTLHQLHK